MALVMKTSSPGWISLRGEGPEGVELFEAASAVAEIPGVKLSQWDNVVQLEAHRNVEVCDAWRMALSRFEIVDRVERSHFTSRYAGLENFEPLELYEHQRDAVRFLVAAGGGLLCDAPGLGKTRSAIFAASELRQLRNDQSKILIVAPRYARAVWRSELIKLGVLSGRDDPKWMPIETTSVDGSTWERLKRADWWFIHPDISHEWAGRLTVAGRISSAIVDEAHWFRAPSARRTKAVHAIVGVAPHRFVLTGTPMANHTRELWSLLTLCDGPYSWGSFGAFRRRYCGAQEDGYGLVDTMPTNVEELQQRMSLRYLRREVKDVGLSLPELTRLRVEVEGRVSETGTGQELEAILVGLQRGTYGVHTLKTMQHLRAATSKAKRNATYALVQGLLEQGERCVVFAAERKMVERLSADAEGSIYIHGELDQEERDHLVERFQDGYGTALFATFGSLKEGVTLHAARHVVLHDLSWDPSEILQAEARVHRIGQRRSVIAHWMTLANSFDELLFTHLQRKSRDIAMALQDQTARRAMLAVGGDQAVGSVEDAARKLLAGWKELSC